MSAGGGGFKSDQDPDIQRLVANPLAVDNSVVCRSVAVAIDFLFAKYPLKEHDPLIQNALAEFSRYVASQQDAGLSAAWTSYQQILAEPLNQLDRVGDRVYPLKQVFTLVYRASVDQGGYSDGNNDEKSKQNRLASMASSIKTLHDKGRRCHQGVRNDLVQILHGVYPGVELAADPSILCQSLFRDQIAAMVTQKPLAERNRLYQDWALNQEMPEAFVAELIAPAQKGALMILINAKYAKQLGITPKEAIKETRSILEGYFDEEVLPYLDQIPRGVQSVRELWDFHALTVHPTLLASHQRVKTWAETQWHFESKNALISDFLLIEKANRFLLAHGSALAMEHGELVGQVKGVIDRFGLGDPIAELSAEERGQLSDFSEKDAGVDFITHFFAKLYALPEAERVAFARVLLKGEWRERIKVDEAWVEGWKPTGPDRSLDITPYQINRMLLTAMLVHTGEWGPKFAERLKEVVGFIRSDFNQAGWVGQTLRRDSYPDALLLSIDFILRSYHSEEPTPMTPEEGQSFISSGLKMLSFMARVRSRTFTLSSLIDELNHANDQERHETLVAVQDRLKGMINSAEDLIRVLILLDDEDDHNLVLHVVRDNLGGFICSADDLVDLLKLLGIDHYEIVLVAVESRLETIIQSANDLINVLSLLGYKQIEKLLSVIRHWPEDYAQAIFNYRQKHREQGILTLSSLWESNNSFRESVINQPENLKFFLGKISFFPDSVKNSLCMTEIFVTLRKLSDEYNHRGDVEKTEKDFCDFLKIKSRRLVDQLLEECPESNARKTMTEINEKLQSLDRRLFFKNPVFQMGSSRLEQVVNDIKRHFCSGFGNRPGLLGLSVLGNSKNSYISLATLHHGQRTS